MCTKTIFHVYVLLALCCCYSSSAQEFNFNVKRYTVEDGLSHRAVRCLFQDHSGFIWVGTEQGLNRFDGYTFKYWTKADNGLLNDEINSIYEDADHMLWLFSTKENISSIEIFDPLTEKGIPFSKRFEKALPNPDIKLTDNYVTDNQGSIYIGTIHPSGILKYNPRNGFEFIPTKEGYIFNPEVFTGNNTLWGKFFVNGIESHHGDMVEFDMHGKMLHNLGKAFIKQPLFHSFSEDGSFYYEKQLTLSSPLETWFHNEKGQEIHLFKQDIERQAYQARPLWVYLKDKKLLAHETIIEDPQTGKIALDLRDFIPELKQTGVQAWIVDRSGLLWIGCAFGMCTIDIRENQFKNLIFNGNNQSLGIAVRGILPMEDGTIRVNTEQFGQWAINKSSGKATHFAQGSPVYYYALGTDNSKNLYYSNTREFFEKLSPSGAKEKFDWKGGLIWCFYNDNRQNLWIGTGGNGLATFDLSHEKINYFNKYNQFKELASGSIYYINNDKTGNIWVCSETGLYQLDPEKGITGRYWSGGKGKYYLPHDYFLHFYIDADNTFWLATSGGGLIKWDQSTGKSTRFGRKSGLPVETIYAVYEDSHNHLWLPSDYGIIQFDKIKGEVRRIFGTSNGISHKEFNRISYARDEKGKLYFGGLNGITSFNPDVFYGQSIGQNAPLVIADCYKFDGSLGKMVNITLNVLKTHEIRLSSKDKYFSLDLSLLTYLEPLKIQYAYRFEDEKEWHFQEGRTLRFGGLPYGNKKLLIKAQAANGVWSANELSLIIKQFKPFYFEWWFILFCIALSFGLIRWRLWRLQKRQKQLELEIYKATVHIGKQAEELRHLDEIKSRFFTNVSHELRTPLTLILGPIGTLLKKAQQKDQDYKLLKLAQQQSKHLLGLINQILDLSKLESKKLELNETNVKLQYLIMQIFGSFENHAQRLGVHYYMNYYPQPNLIVKLDVNKFETIITNVLANALKFSTSEGTLIVDVEDVMDNILITISDSGSGIHPDDLPYIFDRYYQSKQPDLVAAGGTGIGLALCKELVELMGGKIWVESELGKGSKFFVRLPRKLVNEGAETTPNQSINPDSEDAITGSLVEVNSDNNYADKINILIVEDNNSLSDYLNLILSPSYRIIIKENGEAAFKWLEAHEANLKPDLIISDIMMPVMDGMQLLSRIKQDERFSMIPVIMLTAKAEISDKLRALRIGVDDYLLKPFDDEELLVRIKNLLANYQNRRQYSEKEIDEIIPDNSTSNIDGSKVTLPANNAWLEKLENHIQENLQDSNLTTDQLAESFSMSRSAFYRQVKKLTGLAPSEYLDEARFYKARMLLETTPGIQVKEVAFMVGFIKVKYFSKRFQQRFGKYPSDYLE